MAESELDRTTPLAYKHGVKTLRLKNSCQIKFIGKCTFPPFNLSVRSQAMEAGLPLNKVRNPLNKVYRHFSLSCYCRRVLERGTL